MSIGCRNRRFLSAADQDAQGTVIPGLSEHDGEDVALLPFGQGLGKLRFQDAQVFILDILVKTDVLLLLVMSVGGIEHVRDDLFTTAQAPIAC